MDQIAQICELIMLLCFGLSWPISVWKSIQTRSTKGKSPIFLSAIIIGYISGITGKLVSGNIKYVLIFYCINLLVVSTDLVLYFVNRHREKQEKN